MVLWFLLWDLGVRGDEGRWSDVWEGMVMLAVGPGGGGGEGSFWCWAIIILLAIFSFLDGIGGTFGGVDGLIR